MKNRKDEKFMRMTTGQALVKFLDNQYVSFDGKEEKILLMGYSLYLDMVL